MMMNDQVFFEDKIINFFVYLRKKDDFNYIKRKYQINFATYFLKTQLGYVKIKKGDILPLKSYLRDYLELPKNTPVKLYSTYFTNTINEKNRLDAEIITTTYYLRKFKLKALLSQCYLTN